MRCDDAKLIEDTFAKAGDALSAELRLRLLLDSPLATPAEIRAAYADYRAKTFVGGVQLLIAGFRVAGAILD